MEESLNEHNLRAVLVALVLRVEKAIWCHQGLLHAEGGRARSHVEKGKQTWTEGQPWPEGGVPGSEG